jgi:oxygen-independent coproporphyrinogen-3 oxidase
MSIGLYLHIPFCRTKCGYCDFLSFANPSKDNIIAYKAALINEINQTKLNNPADTVYIGGGTPTALPAPFLCEIIQGVRKRFTLTTDCEFTVEANPCTLGGETLAMLKENGVNRLSIGLQAWQNHLLSAIGRTHSQEDFIQNYHAARNIGFANISVDLMFALPYQTLYDWHETLMQVIALRPEHISAYSLTPEEGTPLWQRRNTLPDDKTDRAMYHTAKQMLADAGYVHYEISNWCKPDCKSKHNTRYWKRRPYLGLGLGAHSFDGEMRWNNTDDPEKYLSNKVIEYNRENITLITETEARYEKLILGLRLMEGVEVDAFEGYEQAVSQLIGDGLLIKEGEAIKLTPKGIDLANQVFIAF